MKRIILDTNVFVSGIFWSGAPAKILEAWQDGAVKFILTADILDEYLRISDKLSKKYKIDFMPFIQLLTTLSDFYEPVLLKEPVSRDPDDDKFIAAALAANCKLIVSGDKDLLDVSGYADILVLKPGDFLKDYLL